MTVLRVNTTDEQAFPRRRNPSEDPGRRGLYCAPPCRQVQCWPEGMAQRTVRRRDVVREKRRPLKPFSSEGVRRDVIFVTLSLLLVLFLCVLAADISAVMAGSSRIGRLNVSISSLEESNSLLRQELSRAGSRAFTLPEAGGQESGWIVLPSRVPEE